MKMGKIIDTARSAIENPDAKLSLEESHDN